MTRISLPSSPPSTERMVGRDLGLVGPVVEDCVGRHANLGADLHDRLHLGFARDLDIRLTAILRFLPTDSLERIRRSHNPPLCAETADYASLNRPYAGSHYGPTMSWPAVDPAIQGHVLRPSSPPVSRWAAPEGAHELAYGTTASEMEQRRSWPAAVARITTPADKDFAERHAHCVRSELLQ